MSTKPPIAARIPSATWKIFTSRACPRGRHPSSAVASTMPRRRDRSDEDAVARALPRPFPRASTACAPLPRCPRRCAAWPASPRDRRRRVTIRARGRAQRTSSTHPSRRRLRGSDPRLPATPLFPRLASARACRRFLRCSPTGQAAGSRRRPAASLLFDEADRAARLEHGPFDLVERLDLLQSCLLHQLIEREPLILEIALDRLSVLHEDHGFPLDDAANPPGAIGQEGGARRKQADRPGGGDDAGDRVVALGDT